MLFSSAFSSVHAFSAVMSSLMWASRSATSACNLAFSSSALVVIVFRTVWSSLECCSRNSCTDTPSSLSKPCSFALSTRVWSSSIVSRCFLIVSLDKSSWPFLTSSSSSSVDLEAFRLARSSSRCAAAVATTARSVSSSTCFACKSFCAERASSCAVRRSARTSSRSACSRVSVSFPDRTAWLCRSSWFECSSWSFRNASWISALLFLSSTLHLRTTSTLFSAPMPGMAALDGCLFCLCLLCVGGDDWIQAAGANSK
mmetsp:Transcript_25372/g.76424  ORF Transcript_25372/g.76424 Transcript_25372/m.76424 type:complete len:257 (-) Transcript_25372:173-943(-)